MNNNRHLNILSFFSGMIFKISIAFLKLSHKLSKKRHEENYHFKENPNGYLSVYLGKKCIYPRVSDFIKSIDYSNLESYQKDILIHEVIKMSQFKINFSIKETKINNQFDIFIGNDLYMENVHFLEIFSDREIISNVSNRDYDLIISRLNNLSKINKKAAIYVVE